MDHSFTDLHWRNYAVFALQANNYRGFNLENFTNP